MITFSGIDCSGKSTQIAIIKDDMQKKGRKVEVIWSRGGYTPWVEAIKTLVRPDKHYSEEQKKAYRESISSNSWKSKLLLLASIWDLARYYGIAFRFKELFGTTIICDRYIWDTYIDFKLKFSRFDFEKWLSWKLMLKIIKKPDHSIIFTIPAEESMRRSDLKNDPHPEPYELRVKRIGYYMDEIAKNRWEHVIDAQKSIDDVAEQVKRIIDPK